MTPTAAAAPRSVPLDLEGLFGPLDHFGRERLQQFLDHPAHDTCTTAYWISLGPPGSGTLWQYAPQVDPTFPAVAEIAADRTIRRDRVPTSETVRAALDLAARHTKGRAAHHPHLSLMLQHDLATLADSSPGSSGCIWNSVGAAESAAGSAGAV